MAETCKCACCQELAAMMAHPDTDFDYRRACHCAGYPAEQQCDCYFCTTTLNANSSREAQ